ncbi:TetR/AcrR family transcriptional regulator [Winogradskya consettensis]|uniref:TetR/AcrR family transcriptional regulator n=1 Tax=Winogradskya consettensis TaxID=113560 RepID=UPI001BB32F2F|nr:TetR/AcrR family transcriptional regulator [Actinoplanes consettensis]
MDAELALAGRRERKKAATRAHISDTALKMFLEKGYENVTVRDVASAADVSPTTLLNHFATKEALVVDRESEISAQLVRTVAGRGPGVGILDALRVYAHTRIEHAAAATDPNTRSFMALVAGNRDLAEYWHRMWMGHEKVLAEAIREQTGVPLEDPRPAVIAHLVLGAIDFALRSADSRKILDAAFDVIINGGSIE